MSNLRYLIIRNPYRVVIIMAIVVVLMTGLVLFATLLGWPEKAYQIAKPLPAELSAEVDIAGSAWFDKDSYFMGEVAIAGLRVIYRENSVTPDFDSFRNYINFQPFEQRDVTWKNTPLGEGINEYVVEYKLQAMGEKSSGHYSFSPATLYYNSLAEQRDNLHSLRISLPQVYVAEYYPQNIRGIPLLDLKLDIVDPLRLRQGYMLSAATALIGLTIFLLWNYGRRRQYTELTEPERLWFEFNEFRNKPIDNRAYLLNCERIFSGLLTGHVNVSPEKFWSGTEAEYGDVSNIAPDVRDILSRIYQIEEPEDADVEEITLLLEETLSALVEEKRLAIEQEPAFTARLRQQPGVTMLAGVLTVIALVAIFFAIRSSLWLAADITEYNRIFPQLENGVVIEENFYTELTALADESDIDIVRAAAYYNAGTIRANQSFASSWLTQDEQRTQHELLLQALFQQITAEAFLHNLLGPFFHTQDEVVITLTNGAEHLLRAELDLQAAVRVQPHDESIRRNLEIVAKRRWLLLNRLAQIRAYFEEKEANREDDDVFSETGLIDIINAKLVDEFEENAEGSDDRGYIILERF